MWAPQAVTELLSQTRALEAASVPPARKPGLLETAPSEPGTETGITPSYSAAWPGRTQATGDWDGKAVTASGSITQDEHRTGRILKYLGDQLLPLQLVIKGRAGHCLYLPAFQGN